MQHTSIRIQLVQWLSTVRSSSIDFVQENRILVIICYIIFIGLLIAGYYYSKNIILRVQKENNKWFDQLRYRISTLLYKHQSSIYDFHNTLPLLLHHKNEMIAHHDDPSKNANELIKEWTYIFQLLINEWENEVQSDLSPLLQSSAIVQHILHTQKRISWLLSVFTLGISKLFIKS